MTATRLAIVACVVVLGVAMTGSFAAATSVAEMDESLIRCKVCERAIGYIWHQGVALRLHCRENHQSADHRCDNSNMHHFGIHEMVHEVCDKLPRTHATIEHSEFDLVLHHDPQHPTAVAEKIRNACVKWVHHEHGLDAVSLYLYANLDSGKSTDTILHSLQHRFCKNACNVNYKQERRVEPDNYPNARESTSKSNKNADL